ncbi:unnamed protein product [Gongylonema pulchrum]|uniref:Edg1 TPR repeats region domain-containing protein n=1 Tax=Gongylonema pulchrum TaxID=637853 RepID=A0A3P7PTB5_9BILA|nr:unnamed protein product [Gongylonema pulchrum]
MRNLPGYCNVKLEAALANSSNTEQKAPILVIALRHIVVGERAALQMGVRRRNLIYTCAALCRERREVLKDVAVENGLLSFISQAISVLKIKTSSAHSHPVKGFYFKIYAP